MTEEMNIISISCKVCVDCNGSSLPTDSEQIIFKNHVNALFNIANKHIGHTNRIVLTNANGAAIAYMGPPEHAMLVATNIINEIIAANKQGLAPLFGRIGIHSEPARELNDFIEQPNIIGDGINRAQLLMNNAKLNEIIVSRSYYENVPQSIQVLSTLFHDPIIDHENQLLNYQAYLAGLNKDQSSENLTSTLNQSINETLTQPSFEKTSFFGVRYWIYSLAGLLIVVGLSSIVKLAMAPVEALHKTVKTFPIKASKSAILKTPATQSEIASEKSFTSDKDNGSVQEKLSPSDPMKATLPKKNIKQKTQRKVDSIPKKLITREPSSWETLKNSIKLGKKIECTQPQIAMNQCH